MSHQANRAKPGETPANAGTTKGRTRRANSGG
jgi:hypothetical protein